MCDHRISAQLRSSTNAGVRGSVDDASLCEAYDRLAPAVYGVLRKVMPCEDRVSEVMVHSFTKACAQGGAAVSLARLLQCAFAAACAEADPVERPVLVARITAWYAAALADGVALRAPNA